MICTFTIPREAMATLHCDPFFPMFVNAWRAYEQGNGDAELLVFMQTATTMRHLRDRFPALPRLRMSSMDAMLLFLIDSPGLVGICAFAGGHFTRALRRVNANLHGRFDQVADPPAPPPSPPRLQRVPSVVDLSIVPDTPCLLCMSPAMASP